MADEQQEEESDSEPSCDNLDPIELERQFRSAVLQHEEASIDMTEAASSKGKRRTTKKTTQQKQRVLPPREPVLLHRQVVKPIQYNDIVETIEGVHKQTKKLQRRFTLLTKQIEAKLLQNQQSAK